MRNLKKILALVLVLVMAMSFASAAYADADSINYTEAVDVMSYAGIFNGIDGEFQPQGNLTREQAMKIVAYMMLGQYKADNLPKDIQPFADVQAGRWSAGAIAYCASKGIVSGDGTGNFDPTANVTGYQFGKMVMGAVGIKGNFTGEGWEFNVALALDENDLLTNLEDVILSADMTREQACQMAFNALQYSVTGNYTGRYYVVATEETTSAAAIEMDGELFDSRADAIVTMAALGCALNTDYTVEAETDNRNSLAAKVHYVYDGVFTDDFGFQTYAWYSFDSNNELVVISATPYSHYHHYETGVVTTGELFATLGRTKYDDAITARVITDGVESTVEVAFGGKTELGGNGVSTTIFWNRWTESLKIIEVTTFVGVVSNVREAKAETATKLPVPAMADITVGGTTYSDIKTDAYENDDVVLVTIANGKIQSHELAEAVVGTVDKYVAEKTVTIDGTSYKKAEAAVKMIDSGATVDVFNDTYVYYTDGVNVYDCVPYVGAGAQADGYAYVLNWQVTASGFAGDLFNSAVANTAAAKATVVNLDGSVEVVDLAVAYDKATDTYYVKSPAGVLTPIDAALVAAHKNGAVEVANWASYQLVDGAVSFLANESEAFTTTKGNIDVGSYTMTTKTVYTYINTKDGTLKTTTGYKNIELTAEKALVIADRYGYVSNVYVVKTTTDYGTSYADLALAVKSGAEYALGYEWTFYVNGDVVTKVVAKDVTVEAGCLYTLVINDLNGTVKGVEKVADTNALTKYTVTWIDDTYFKGVDSLGAEVNFELDANCLVFNYATGAEDTLAVKTTVVCIDFDEAGDTLNDIDLIYVIPAAE